MTGVTDIAGNQNNYCINVSEVFDSVWRPEPDLCSGQISLVPYQIGVK